jgi:hypothetical protein
MSLDLDGEKNPAMIGMINTNLALREPKVYIFYFITCQSYGENYSVCMSLSIGGKQGINALYLSFRSFRLNFLKPHR